MAVRGIVLGSSHPSVQDYDYKRTRHHPLMVDRFGWPSCTSLHSEPQDEAPRIGERCDTGPTQPKRARAANTVNGTLCSIPSPAFTAGTVQARRGRNRSRSGAGFDCFL